MTAEQISASYDSSIVVRRWGATVMDFLLLLGIGAVAMQVPEAAQGVALLIFVTVVVPLYYLLLEWRLGATVGKLVCQIRVVDARGQRPSLGQVAGRSLLRLIEVNPVILGGIPAGIAVLASKRRQRLGDMVAGTLVLKTEDLGRVGAYEPELDGTQPKRGADWLGPTGRSPWAIAAGYLGLTAILLLPAPLALGAGIMALRDIARTPGLGGKGRAWFGILSGGLFTLFGLLAVVPALMQ